MSSGGGETGGGAGNPCCLGVGGSCIPCRRDCHPDDCGDGPCVLAENEDGAAGVIVAQHSVLWTSTTGGRIGRLNLTNGQRDDLVAAEGPTLMATNGSLAVWVAKAGIGQCPVDSGNCTGTRRQIFSLTAEGATLVRGLAVDDSNAYWTEGHEKSRGAPMRRCRLDPRCLPTDSLFYANNAHPKGIAADPGLTGYVYWASAFSVRGQGRVQRILKSAARDGLIDVVAAGLDFP